MLKNLSYYSSITITTAIVFTISLYSAYKIGESLRF